MGLSTAFSCANNRDNTVSDTGRPQKKHFSTNARPSIDAPRHSPRFFRVRRAGHWMTIARGQLLP